mgnify:CR=1 FL=1
MSEVKFTDDELSKLKEIQQNYVNIQVQLGQIGIARIRMESQLNEITNSEIDLRKNFDKNSKEEATFLEDIRKKYGDGELNPETGVFTKKS